MSNMDEKETDFDSDSEFRLVFTALDELKLLPWKSFFKKHLLQDVALSYMKDEEELKRVLTKELDPGLPFGIAFVFSRHWFKKYHAEALSVTSQKKADSRDESEGLLLEKGKELELDGTINHSVTNQEIKTEDGKERPLPLPEERQEPSQTSQKEKDDAAFMTERSVVRGKASLGNPGTNGTGNTWPKDSKAENLVRLLREEVEQLNDQPIQQRELSKEYNGRDQNHDGGKSEIIKMACIGITKPSQIDEDSPEKGKGEDKVYEETKIATDDKYNPTSSSASPIDAVTFTTSSTSAVKQLLGGTEEPYRTEAVLDHLTESNSSPSVVQISSILEKDKGDVLEEQEISTFATEDLENLPEEVSRCTPRPFGKKGRENCYQKGFVLDIEENREVEFKSLVSAPPNSLPWKMMEKAKRFICACLNADTKGIIYFGVGDCQEQGAKYKRGEVLGLDVECTIDDIVKAFQFLLDDHLRSDAGPLQKGGEQNCVRLEFVPVTSQGQRTSLYVIEIEVVREWKFCKDNIYYSKSWTEKRDAKNGKDPSTKKALREFFKVHDEFDDVAIRTNGASNSVKKHEVMKQVKEPLRTKYKEWKKEAKFAMDATINDVAVDDADTQNFSKVIRERLHGLNFKDFGYILVANKLPPQYRGTPYLSFLQNIPWVAVFDLFDASSKKDGLHYACNETTDAPRAKIRTLDDFKEVSSDWISDKEFSLSTRGTTWIFNNEEMQKRDWIKDSKDCLYRALSAYKVRYSPGRLLCVFLGLGENAVLEMSDIMECCFSIFGNYARSCVTVISENKLVAEGFVKASKPSLQKELKDCSITGIPWALLKEIVREMVGPAKFEERNATVELPFFTGKLKEVLNKVIQSWDDLEVYSPSPRLPKYSEEIEKARDAFYKGAHANQINLFHNHSIERTLEDDINFKVDHALKSLSKPSTELSCHVKTVTVPYEPGSGATTLCRRILWKKRKGYRCAVIKAFTTATDFQIEELQGICYDEKNLKYSTPALVLVDNFPEIDIRRLTERIMKRKTKCVILSTFPIAKSDTNVFDVKPLRQLDECETSRVKNILINITSDAERRREAEQILDREKRFIWFGLELFGREYDKIEERLRSHIKSTLTFIGDSKETHEMILQFCCFLHYYSDGRAILPHPVVSDFLYEASDKADEQCAYMQHVHDIFGGLLLEGFNETNGYYGWRPAHSLVSEVVTSTLDVNETALLLLENVDKGTAYVNKFLRQQLFKVFLDRKRISDPVFLENLGTDDDSIESDFELEVLGFYEVRTRYSPLIVDIVKGESGIEGALELLIAICEKANPPEDKAYAWQQLARFVGYEMRSKSINNKDRLHKRLYNTMKAAKSDLKRPTPETGIEAAHIAVDIAIDHQPKYSHHYVTKGVLYHLQLRDFTPDEHTKLSCLMTEVIDICRKALEVYDKALSTTNTLNLYSMIGKIQAIVSLLTIVKGLPCFGREGESFTRYLKNGEIPLDMDALTKEEHEFVQSLRLNTLDLLNQLFRDVKFRQMTTYNESEVRGLSNAKIRASKLRRAFYKITGFDKSELINDAEFSLASSPVMKEPYAVYQQHVQDILFKHDETPYSTWERLSDGDVSSIYNLLRGLCRRGYGSHDDMLTCCKACLRLKERPSVEELGEIVKKWVEKFSDSEWAHLFNYMLHFPIPNRSLGTDGHCARTSIKTCDKIVREKTNWGYRKSGAEYFLGKGIGLRAIVTSQEFRATSQESRWLESTKETKTDFWRSKEVSDKLERVCGQKDVNFKGVITYEGIQLRFDNTRYPNESKDDLWFYIGFSLAGPYAYDPVDNDRYDIMKRKTEEATPFIPSAPAVSKPSETFGTFSGGIGRGKIRDKVVKGPDPKMQFEGLNHDFPDLSQNTESQRAKGLRSPTPLSLSTSFSLSDVSRVSGGATSLTRFHSTFCKLSQSASVDDLHQSDTFPPSYASALQYGTPTEVDGAKTATRQPTGETLSKSKWKSVKGVCGNKTRLFKPRYVDEQGKLHHGATVLGAQKSLECKKHIGPDWSTEETSRCPFAHAWRGDTVQTVCRKCTDRSKRVCRDRRDHKEFLWNLGPYITEEGKDWESPGGSI